MAIATKTKPKTTAHKKRAGEHHRRTKHYVKSYWPYLPMVALVAAGLFVNSLLGSSPAAVLGAQSTFTEQALLSASNLSRSENQVTNLTLNPDLEEAAQTKAENMVRGNYWNHNTPDGKTPWDFIAASGYQYQAAGENLAYGFNSPDAIIDAWMHSPEHRANLLSTTYTEVGFGVAQSPNYVGQGPETVIVAMYAQPAGINITATVDASSKPDLAAQPITSSAVKGQAVTRVQTFAPAISGFVVGVIGTLAISFVLLRHSFAWRKMLTRGEMFILHHPLLDISLVAIAMLAVILNHTVGFIY